MARYSGPGEPGVYDAEGIYIQRPLPSAEAGFHRRLWGFIIIVLISFCLLLGRTWQLQVMQGDYFPRLSEHNRLRSLRTKGLRGKLLDRHGYVLADNRAAYTLMAIPVDLPPNDQLLTLLRTLYISLFDVNSAFPGSYPFVGLGNYTEALGRTEFWAALLRTGHHAGRLRA